MTSPLLTPGVHRLRVYYGGDPAEDIVATVLPSGDVGIVGPRWTGRGVVRPDGGYIGEAVLADSQASCFHFMRWQLDSAIGKAYYAGGNEDILEWRLVA